MESEERSEALRGFNLPEFDQALAAMDFAEVAKLRWQLAEAQAETRRMNNSISNCAIEILHLTERAEKAEAALHAARLDTERLEWLVNLEGGDFGKFCEAYCPAHISTSRQSASNEEWRAAIDAARKEPKCLP